MCVFDYFLDFGSCLRRLSLVKRCIVLSKIAQSCQRFPSLAKGCRSLTKQRPHTPGNFNTLAPRVPWPRLARLVKKPWYREHGCPLIFHDSMECYNLPWNLALVSFSKTPLHNAGQFLDNSCRTPCLTMQGVLPFCPIFS